MASPTVYKWTDAGAPQFTRGDVAAIQAIFQACLIDGYGSKTPPVSGANPWSIPFSDATSFILKQGGSSARKMCFKFSGFGPYSADIQVARDYTALSTPVDEVTTNPSYQKVGFGDSTSATYNIPWMIFATERALYAFFGYNNTSDNIGLLESDGSETVLVHHWFIGDYKCYNPSIVVNQMFTYQVYNSTNNAFWSQNFTYQDSNQNSPYGAKMLCGNFHNAHGAYGVETFWSRLTSGGTTNPGARGTDEHSPQYPDPLTNEFHIEPMRLVSYGAIMGEFPGMLIPLAGAPFNVGGNYVVMPGTGAYSGTNIYVFRDSLANCFMLHDGNWGVE